MNAREPDPPYENVPDIVIPASVAELREEIRCRFPKDAKAANRRTDKIIGDWALGHWFDEFSKRTTAAMRRRDEETVIAHLNFFSERLRTADPDVRGVIDVNYVENLMSDLGEESQRWAWTRLPENLKELYIAFWGRISPSRLRMLEISSA